MDGLSATKVEDRRGCSINTHQEGRERLMNMPVGMCLPLIIVCRLNISFL